MPGRGRWDQQGEMLFSASYNNQETPTGNGRRVAQSCPSESRATLLISQHSRQAWRALYSLYAFPISIVKNLLQDREAGSLTSRGNIIHYLSSVSITPTCSSRNETRKNLELLNLAFFLWWGKAEVWLWLLFSFSKIFLSSEVLQEIRKDFLFHWEKMWNQTNCFWVLFSCSVIPIAKMLCSVNLSTVKPEEKFIPNLLMFDPIKHLVLLLGLPVGLPVSAIFDRRIFHVKVCLGEFDGGYQLFPWLQNNGA